MLSNKEAVHTQQVTRPGPSPQGEQPMRSEFHFFYLVRTSIIPKPEVMATREKARDALRLVIVNRCFRQSGSARATEIDARTSKDRDLRQSFSAPFKDILFT